MTNNILAPEILAHVTPARALAVGDLAVFTDYKGRQVGCKITHMWAAGVITREAQVQIRACGLSVPAPYIVGTTLIVDASSVARAI